MDLALAEHGLAAVGSRAEPGRQEPAFDQLLDRVARFSLRGRVELGQLHDLDVGGSFQAAQRLDAVGGAGEVAEEGLGKVDEHRVVALERQDAAGMAEFPRIAQRSPALGRLQEAGRQGRAKRSRSGNRR